MKKQNVLITSANKQFSLVKEIIKEANNANADSKVYTCDMNPESVSGIIESDGCFKVPICTSEIMLKRYSLFASSIISVTSLL